MRTRTENSLLSPTQSGCSNVWLRASGARKCGLFGALIFAAMFTSFAWSQNQSGLTLDQIGKLLKGGVGPARVAQLVEQRGIAFELNDATLGQLKADGANQVVLAAVKKVALRYVEDQRRKRLKEAADLKLVDEREREEANAQRLEQVRQELREREKKKEEEKKLFEAQKRQPEIAQKGKQEPASNIEESKEKIQEAANQKPRQGAGATLMTQEDAGRVASLRNIVLGDAGEVSGEFVNGTKNTVRDVQLQIVYSWRWKNESKPGKDDPGTARYYVLGQEIPPKQTKSFKYKPSPPLASRDDGRFDITVKVVGFTQVTQQPGP